MSELQEKLSILSKLFVRKKDFVIFLHDNPDPDAIASGCALQYFVKKRFNINAVIVYGGFIARAENKAMVKHLKLDLTHISKYTLNRNAIFALVDTQPGGNNSFPANIIPHIIIDHHPLKSKDFIDSVPFLDVRIEIGATVTILYEYFALEKIVIPKLLATGMYYGINSETQDLGREATDEDQEACINLFPKASKKILSWIIHPKNNREYFAVLAKGLNNAYTDNNIAYVHLGEISAVDYIHQIADLLLTCENIRWSLCTGWNNNSLFMSLRATNQRAKAGLLAKKLVGSLGSAGGHDTMAGGKIEWIDVFEDHMKRKLENMLTRRFIKYCTSSKEEDFFKLISI